MKKLCITCAVLSAILLAGCNNDMLEVTDATNDTFVASIESFENYSDTKTSLSAKNAVVWNAGDQIAIFQGAPVVSRFEVDDACSGTSKGAFNLVQESSSQGGGFTSVMEIAANVAVYPYAQELALSESSNDAEEHSYTITNVTVPSVQKYLENSFPKGTFAMVAVTESATDKVLKFKNVLGAIKLQLLGECKIKSIKIEGNNNEVLSGNAKITAFKGAYSPAITMLEEQPTSITLNCQEGVQLNPDNATSFILAVPPTTFEEGFTLTVTDVAGKRKVMRGTSTNTVRRSYILKMPELNVSQMTDIENVDYILFEDELVEELCVKAFDINNDGKLQYTEAAAVTDLSPMSFANCKVKSFNELQYFTSVAEIPQYYFHNQTRLKNIILPQSLEEIGKYAFSGCVAVNNFSLPEGLNVIGAGAFYNCTSITKIEIPFNDEWNQIYASTFEGCTSLRSVTSNEREFRILSNAFRGCVSLVECDILRNADAILEGAFYGCESLEEVVFRDGILSIGDSAFEECRSLSRITFGTANEANKLGIFNRAFANCTSLEEVSFNNVEVAEDRLGSDIFEGCTSLEKIVLPTSWGASIIPEGMFRGCSSLSEVNIPSSVTELGDYAFCGCVSLTSIQLPSGIKILGESVFEGSSLTSIQLPSSIIVLGKSAFKSCQSLTSVGMLCNIDKIDVWTFAHCSSLESIQLPSSIKTIGIRAFLNCSSLKSITLSSELENIGSYAFSSCSTLETVQLPSGVKAIGAYAFQYCSSIKSITLPSDLTSMGYRAFNMCSSLQSCTIESSSLTAYGDPAFKGCTNLAHIYVPSTAVDTYKAGWPSYADLIKPIQ